MVQVPIARKLGIVHSSFLKRQARNVRLPSCTGGSECGRDVTGGDNGRGGNGRGGCLGTFGPALGFTMDCEGNDCLVLISTADLNSEVPAVCQWRLMICERLTVGKTCIDSG